MSPKVSRYPTTGFMLLSALSPDGLISHLADTDNIAKGDALHDDGNGKATNAITAFAATFLGIAAEDCDNSGDDDKSVLIIPPLQKYRFIVAVEENAEITQGAVGSICDLQSVNTIDINDTSIAAGPGFMIDEIDVSTLALAANTYGYGYAIGHFQLVS